MEETGWVEISIYSSVMEQDTQVVSTENNLNIIETIKLKNTVRVTFQEGRFRIFHILRSSKLIKVGLNKEFPSWIFFKKLISIGKRLFRMREYHCCTPPPPLYFLLQSFMFQ